MSDKKFQHFIKWFDIFIRAKTNMQKKKGKIKQKIKEKTLPGAPGESSPSGPPGPEGQRGLLPPPAPPSCSVECHRASRGRHVAAERLPGLPVPSSRAWRRPEASPLHSPPPRAPSPPLSPVSSSPEKNAGAPSSPRVATVLPVTPRAVQRNRSRRLRLHVR